MLMVAAVGKLQRARGYQIRTRWPHGFTATLRCWKKKVGGLPPGLLPCQAFDMPPGPRHHILLSDQLTWSSSEVSVVCLRKACWATAWQLDQPRLVRCQQCQIPAGRMAGIGTLQGSSTGAASRAREEPKPGSRRRRRSQRAWTAGKPAPPLLRASSRQHRFGTGLIGIE